MEKTVVEYGGIEIEYLEDVNKWQFELRGRERKADSLKAAKAAIDKPDPKAKKSFVPIPAWMRSSRFNDEEGWVKVTVTSVADKSDRGLYGRREELWIVNNGKRSKERADRFHADTPENAAIRAEIDRLTEVIAAAETKRGEIEQDLTRIELPGE